MMVKFWRIFKFADRLPMAKLTKATEYMGFLKIEENENASNEVCCNGVVDFITIITLY